MQLQHFVKIYFFYCLLSFVSLNEYGYSFTTPHSHIQGHYKTLCNDSKIGFDFFINIEKGVLFYAANAVRQSTLLVYIERPGVYLNATIGNTKLNVNYLMDFFDNKWIGWHHLQIAIGSTALSIKFDRFRRNIPVYNIDLFPEDFIEGNEVYFGSSRTVYKSKTITIDGYLGYLRNILYKSCGCNVWRSIQFIRMNEISLEQMGECREQSACHSGCNCILSSRGTKFCECSQEKCPELGDDIAYEFDFKQIASSTSRQMELINTSKSLQYTDGLYNDGLKLRPGDSLVLLAPKQRSCFKNMFLCRVLIYSFWIRPIQSISEGLLMEHTFEGSAYGLFVHLSNNSLRVSFVNQMDKKYQISCTLQKLIWQKISVYFNGSDLSIFVDSSLVDTSNQYIILESKSIGFKSSKYLKIGDQKGTVDVELDRFEFSTNDSILSEESFHQLIVEFYDNSTTINHQCFPETKVEGIDITRCMRTAFKNSNFSMGFYLSVVINSSLMLQQRTMIFKISSFLEIYFLTETLLELRTTDGLSFNIFLKPTVTILCFLEFSFSREGKLDIWQNNNRLLHSIDLNKRSSSFRFKESKIIFSSQWPFLKEIRIINSDKSFAQKAYRVVTKFLSNSLDFDRDNITRYTHFIITEGFIDRGIMLRNRMVSFGQWLAESCITDIRFCYHGLSVSFWLKIKTSDKKVNSDFHIFSTSNFGMQIIINYATDSLSFVLHSERVYQTMSGSVSLCRQNWCLLEITISPNKVFHIFINGIQQDVQLTDKQYKVQCEYVCFGQNDAENTNVELLVDEVNVFDIHRNWLYACGYLSRRASEYRLVSFTRYMLNEAFTIDGSAKIITTKYGEGVILEGFGLRSAVVNMTDFPDCFIDIDNCRRGLLIRLWFRPDNLAIPEQIYLSNHFLMLSSNFEYPTVMLKSKNRSWLFIGKTVLQVLQWHVLDISWRSDDGMKVYLNGLLIGHVAIAMNEYSNFDTINKRLVVGSDYRKQGNSYASIVVDDIEFVAADRTNLAYETRHMDDIFCHLRHSFDSRSEVNITLDMGVIGLSGLFNNSQFSVPIPSCFDEIVTGCKECFSLRFWLNLIGERSIILSTNNLRLSVMPNVFNIEIIQKSSNHLHNFYCEFDSSRIIRKWVFMELSWDAEEGLLLWMSRENVFCQHMLSNKTPKPFSESLKISKYFHGYIDELELYKNRLFILYWSHTVDEAAVMTLLRQMQEKEEQSKNIARLSKFIKSNVVKETVDVVDSFLFNGSNYLTYSVSTKDSNKLPGGSEEIEISFKAFKHTLSGIIWMADGLESKTTLMLKNRQLCFSRIYLVNTANKTRVSEEISINQIIIPDRIYNVYIRQKSGKISIKINALNDSFTQSMVGRDTLLPLSGNVYFGGYRKSLKGTDDNVNASFVGFIYKARLRSTSDREDVDILKEIESSKPSSKVKNFGNVKVIKKVVKLEPIIDPKLLGSLVDRKLPLMMNSPFLKVSFPQMNFSTIWSIELECSTYEDRGLILFVRLFDRFVAIELFNSKLFLVIGNLLNATRDLLTSFDQDSNRRMKLFFGRDISGNISIMINKNEAVRNIGLFKHLDNAIVIIGYLGEPNNWPKEIMSRVGFVGCIQYLGIGDLGFMNFSSQYVDFESTSKTGFLSNSPFLIGVCQDVSVGSCSQSTCGGGLCRPTSVSSSGNWIDNFKCDCRYLSKTWKSNFDKKTAKENHDIWIMDYLLQSRSKPCSEDTFPVPVSPGIYVVLYFVLPFPFSYVLDLSFFIILKSKTVCVFEMTSPDSAVVIEILNGIVHFRLNGNYTILLPDVQLRLAQWYLIQIRVIYRSVELSVDQFKKSFQIHILPNLSFTNVSIGLCRGYPSRFQIRRVIYNNLNIFQGIYSKRKSMFFHLHYSIPDLAIPDLRKPIPSEAHSVTLMNNFLFAKATTFYLSSFNQFHITSKMASSGVLFHLTAGEKYLQAFLCKSGHMVIKLKDNEYMDPQYVMVKSENDLFQLTLTFDLIKGIISVTNVASLVESVISSRLFSWNIGDPIVMQIGNDTQWFNNVSVNSVPDSYRSCLIESSQSTVMGCIQSFIWSNGSNLTDIGQHWANIMKTTVSNSVLTGSCRDVLRCSPTTCMHGICKTDFISVHCDCRKTGFTGDRCHIREVICRPDTCTNGLCQIIKDKNENPIYFCNCSGTGYRGRHCEISICHGGYCNNRGACYVQDGKPYCNCSRTGFFGTFCSVSLCDNVKCDVAGSCAIDVRKKSAFCKCQKNFFGSDCSMNNTGKCFMECLNGGICSPYQLGIPLCSNKFCGYPDKFKCSCDETFYRGHHCQEAEQGFNPSQSGVVIMGKFQHQPQNSMRLLFSVAENGSDVNGSAVLVDVSDLQLSPSLFMIERNQLVMQYSVKGYSFEYKLGHVNSENVLLMFQDSGQINFYFNNHLKVLHLPESHSGRRKRDLSVPTVNNVPEIFLGCDKQFLMCFNGIIAGFRWNNQSFLSPNSRLFLNGNSIPIEKLRITRFPKQTPILLLLERKYPTLPILLSMLFLLVLLLLVVLFKRKCFHKEAKRNGVIPIAIQEDEITPNSSPETEIIALVHPSGRTFIISVETDDLDEGFTFIDFILLRESRTILFLVETLPERWFNYKTVADVDRSCAFIRPTFDYSFIYGYIMEHQDEYKAVEYSLMMWRYSGLLTVVSSENEITFTHSWNLPHLPKHLLLLNINNKALFIWDCLKSSVVWTTTFNGSLDLFTVSVDGTHFIGCTVSLNKLILINLKNDTRNRHIYLKSNFSIVEQMISISDNRLLLLDNYQKLWCLNFDTEQYVEIFPYFDIIKISAAVDKSDVKIAIVNAKDEVWVKDLSMDPKKYLSVRAIGMDSIVTCLSFSHDGKLLAAAGKNFIRVWKLHGIQLRFYQIPELRDNWDLRFVDNTKLLAFYRCDENYSRANNLLVISLSKNIA